MVRYAWYNAAKIIGVKEIHFLDRPDGYLVPDMGTRREVTRAIRQFAPDILVTCDPTNLYPSKRYPLNHPDHRAAGQVVLDAVFPAAGSALFFPELLSEGYEPHQPSEVWVSLTHEPNTILDITNTWETKIDAILEHKSQVKDPEALKARMHKFGKSSDSPEEEPRYEERFRVIRWRK
jgi:LmbE family N-acetylglucosaminyl deacetylase